MKVSKGAALRIACADGLSDSDHRVLFLLMHFLEQTNPIPVSPTKLAEVTGWSRGYIARAITRLHKAGFLEEGTRLGQYRSYRLTLP